MNPSAPIGIFDSGLGGLTIVKAIQEVLPNESLIYYGDTAHLPYGDKSPSLVRNYSIEIARFLLEKGVKAIIIACNTASAVARDAVVEIAGEIPVFNVVFPAVNDAIMATQRKRIGVIGTKTTIASGIYRKLIRSQDPSLTVIEKSTPILVPIIEEGWLNNAVSQDIVDAYMSDTGFLDVDTLILGCTHYPLIKSLISKYFLENFAHSVDIIDSSVSMAHHVKTVLDEMSLLNSVTGNGAYQYLVSDYNAHFEESAALFLGKEVKLEKVDLEKLG